MGSPAPAAAAALWLFIWFPFAGRWPLAVDTGHVALCGAAAARSGRAQGRLGRGLKNRVTRMSRCGGGMAGGGHVAAVTATARAALCRSADTTPVHTLSVTFSRSFSHGVSHCSLGRLLCSVLLSLTLTLSLLRSLCCLACPGLPWRRLLALLLALPPSGSPGHRLSGKKKKKKKEEAAKILLFV